VWAQGVNGPAVRDSNVGYVDMAIPADQIRFRFDANENNPRPTRAEFFYPQSGPGNPGTPDNENSVNYQEATSIIEKLITPGLSVFVEVPVRSVDFGMDPTQTGLSDINAGVKCAVISQEDFVTSLQLRTYIPTGDSFRGLGTHHTSLEPALLIYKRLTDRLVLEGEFRDWIPISGTDFAGNVVRFGTGLSYSLYQGERLRIDPVAEMVGWVILSGKDAKPLGGDQFETIDAAGQFILNVKFGLNWKFGTWSELYTGYGRSLTGDRWYTDTARVEFRLLY